MFKTWGRNMQSCMVHNHCEKDKLYIDVFGFLVPTFPQKEIIAPEGREIDHSGCICL